MKCGGEGSLHVVLFEKSRRYFVKSLDGALPPIKLLNVVLTISKWRLRIFKVKILVFIQRIVVLLTSVGSLPNSESLCLLCNSLR